LTPDEADIHPRANEITRALGWQDDLADLEITRHPVEDGDLVVLCSDGLWKPARHAIPVQAARLRRQPLSRERLDEAAAALTDAALAQGSQDNISVALLALRDGAGPNHSEENNHKEEHDHGQ